MKMLFVASIKIIEDGFNEKQLEKAIKVYRKEFTLNDDFINKEYKGTQRDRAKVHRLYKCLKNVIVERYTYDKTRNRNK